jgi:hypothetical protein
MKIFRTIVCRKSAVSRPRRAIGSPQEAPRAPAEARAAFEKSQVENATVDPGDWG